MKKKENKSGLSESFIAGVIAIVFLIVGYQTALFIHRAAVMKVVANRDEPDTVFVYGNVAPDQTAYRGNDIESAGGDGGGYGSEKKTSAESEISESEVLVRKNAAHHPRAEIIRADAQSKNVETFRFDPNTISVDDLCRLGFSPKQAQSIDNYRKKGGVFRRKQHLPTPGTIYRNSSDRLESC